MNNPTNTIDISFDNYVKDRTYKNSLHLEGGIPDYAFASDYSLRQKMKAIPGIYSFFKAVTTQVVPQEKQKLYRGSIQVGPNQFPEVYEITKDCARILGIGIPTVFIENNVGEFNACAYSTEDSEPLIKLTSAIVERCTIEELKAVIGHECGHVHNTHGIYSVAAGVIIDSTVGRVSLPQQIVMLLSTSIILAIQAWNRAAEVTCDRAAIICCGDDKPMHSVNGKLLSGGMMEKGEVNIEEAQRQFEKFHNTPVRILEMADSHPSSVRRIFASKEFMNSEVYYKWHPEQKQPGQQLLNKQELDARCEKYVSVIKNGQKVW